MNFRFSAEFNYVLNRRGFSLVFSKAWIYIINLFVIEFLEAFMIYYLVVIHCAEMAEEVN